MDPATIIAGVGTGVKGCVTLFNLCVGMYDLIDRGSSYAKNHTHLMTKLDVEKFRLLAFGEALRLIGLDTNTQDLSDYNTAASIKQGTWILIERVLCSMKEVFDDAEELDKRYGLKEVKAIRSKGEGFDLISTSTSTRPFAATFQRFQARILKTQKEANFTTKARWAINDSDKFKTLIEKLHGWNNDLDNILLSLQRIGLQRLIVEHEFQMMATVEDIRIIEEVAADDNPTISDAASSRRKILQAPSTLNGATPAVDSASSLSDGSFWTAPSRTVNSLADNFGSLQTAEYGTVPADMTPQNQRLFAAKAPDAKPFQQQNTGLDCYGQVLQPLRMQDAVKLTNLMASAKGRWNRRLMRELKEFPSFYPGNISIAPIDGSIDEMLGIIEGPPDTPYQGGLFFIRIDVPSEYPYEPPRCVFITRIYHPNIGPQGRICMDGLAEKWQPIMGIGSVLISICSILSDPNINDPLVPEIAAQYVENLAIYEQNARLYTQRYAQGTQPTREELELARTRNKENLSLE